MHRILPISLLLLVLAATPASAVIRGHQTPAAKYPWLVDMLGCAGTLVAPDLVLTAGHCIGPSNEMTVGEPFQQGRKYRILRTARHPRYEAVAAGLSMRYDVALIQLSERVEGVTPIPIATTAPQAGERVHLLGRGKRWWFGLKESNWPEWALKSDRQLHTAANVAISDRACQRYYATNRYKRDYFDAADMTCTLDPARKPARKRYAAWASVCSGDSGGPLLRRRPGGGYEQAGVVSWSEWCGLRHDPSVFMRPEMIRAFLAAPVWAPRALGSPQAVREGSRLRCVAPAYEGRVDRLEYQWLDLGKPVGSGETIESPKALTCAVTATNAGGSSRAAGA